jgi:hypothetical protein
MRILFQSNQKEQIKEIWWKERTSKDTMSQVNNNDPKSLESWNTFWAYKSLSFLTKSHSLYYMPLKFLSN